MKVSILRALLAAACVGGALLTVGQAASAEQRNICDSGACRPAYIKANDGNVDFNGEITDEAVDRAMSGLKKGGVLTIISYGGDRSAALRFGLLLRARDATVMALSDCVGSCAMYVFLPAVKKNVVLGSHVFYSPPAATWVRMAENRPDLFSPDLADKVRREAALEADLYRQAGIDPALLRCIDTTLAIDFTTLRLTDEDQDGWKAGNRFRRVAFSKRALESYGVGGLGDYPDMLRPKPPFPEGEAERRIAWLDRANPDCRPGSRDWEPSPAK